MMHKYFDIQRILYFYISKSCKDITRQEDILSRLPPNSSQTSITPQRNLLLIINELKKKNKGWLDQNHRKQIIKTTVSLKSKLGKPDKGKYNALHENIINWKARET